MSLECRDKKISAVVFDFDGTLYRLTEEIQEKIFGETRRKLVEKIIEIQRDKEAQDDIFEYWCKLYFFHVKKIGWRKAFLKLGGSDADFMRISLLASKAEHLHYSNELVEFLKELMKHVPVYIFTGSCRVTVIEALEVLIGDLWKKFENKLLAMDDMEDGQKPDKVAYEEMLRRFELDPKTTIFIDDSQVEVNAAAELGMLTFLIQEESEGRDQVVGSHVLINSVLESLDYLTIKR